MVLGRKDEQQRLVETKCGKIRGVQSKSRDGREFYEWRGIPYGIPPVGPLRFTTPQPFGKWDGVRDGSKLGHRCAELGPFNMVLGSEDCLYLNVSVPKVSTAALHFRKGDEFMSITTNKDKGLPVMFFIHGGGFQNGFGGQYKPHYFMDEDVILVTPNYRLGPLGFVSTGDEVIRGNMGLKDQALALRWVKENIECFGGDPNSITIFGESAGGASVHYQLLSPSTKGLFQRAISQSGVVGQCWGIDTTEDAIKYTKKYAQQFNPSAESSVDMAECLRSVPIKELLVAYRTELGLIHSPHKDKHWFRPCVEGVNDEETFLAEDPFEVIREGGAHRVPWMTGVNAHEGLLCTISFFNHEENMQAFEDHWTISACRAFGIPVDAPYSEDLARKIRDIYFPKDEPTLEKEERFRRFTDLYSDGYFNLRMSHAIDLQRKFSPVYSYYYNRQGGPSLTWLLEPFLKKRHFLLNLSAFIGSLTMNKILGKKPKDFGVCHADELAMLFLLERVFNVPKDESCSDYRFSKDMVKLWVDFAKDETPMEFRGVPFPTQNINGSLQYFEIAERPQLIDEPFQERTDALKALNFLDLNAPNFNSKI